MYGMRRTTVYLPDDLKAAIERTARAQGKSEADVSRAALSVATSREAGPRPRLPLFDSGDPTLAAPLVLSPFVLAELDYLLAARVGAAQRAGRGREGRHGTQDVLTLDERHVRVVQANGRPLRLLPADA
jgi:hypothetical protein